MAAARRLRVLRVVPLLIAVCFISSPVPAKYGGGTGAPDDPYKIYTAEQMNMIGAEPNDWDKHYKLMADIDLKDFEGSSFNLIGSYSNPFKGTFDGNNHTISNLTYIVTNDENETDDDFISGLGLFRYVNDPNAIIRDLVLVDPDFLPAPACRKRLWDVGALVGSFNSGTISSCSVEGGRVLGEKRVGGLVGSTWAVISDCYTKCTVGPAEERSLPPVNETLERREFFGGLAGYNSGEISDCHTIGEVTGESRIGGLAGETSGTISNSWSGGEVSGDADIGGLVGKSRGKSRLSHCHSSGHVSGLNIVGGLVGTCKKNSSIDNSYAAGSVWAEDNSGGLVGWLEGTVSECRATALVFADANNAGGLVGLNGGTIITSWAESYIKGKNHIGGLVGFNWRQDILDYNPVVADSYARSNVHGEDYVGGLVGFNQGGTVSKCYSTSRVRATGTKTDCLKGGLVGLNIGIPVDNSFWDITASGVNQSDGGEGKTTSQMQNMWMYLDAGWDFAGERYNGTDDVWKMCSGRPIYPKLAWEQMLMGDFVDPEGVDLLDLAFLAGHWLQTVSLPCDGPDLTIDARVDSDDFALMARYWQRGAREVIFETSLDEPQDWTAQGQWQFGMPTGGGGTVEGHPDPVGAYTGDNVYGVNLKGDYPVVVDGPHYLTAGPFDCRLYRDVTLQFARWLNTDEADYARASIEFSIDGIKWALVWEYEDTENILMDESWQVVAYHLGAMADHRESLYIRWGYEVKDLEAWPMSGWNIDDVKLSGRQ